MSYPNRFLGPVSDGPDTLRQNVVNIKGTIDRAVLTEHASGDAYSGQPMIELSCPQSELRIRERDLVLAKRDPRSGKILVANPAKPEVISVLNGAGREHRNDEIPGHEGIDDSDRESFVRENYHPLGFSTDTVEFENRQDIGFNQDMGVQIAGTLTLGARQEMSPGQLVQARLPTESETSSFRAGDSSRTVKMILTPFDPKSAWDSANDAVGNPKTNVEKAFSENVFDAMIMFGLSFSKVLAEREGGTNLANDTDFVELLEGLTDLEKRRIMALAWPSSDERNFDKIHEDLSGRQINAPRDLVASLADMQTEENRWIVGTVLKGSQKDGPFIMHMKY